MAANIFWKCPTCGASIPIEQLNCPKCELPPVPTKLENRRPAASAPGELTSLPPKRRWRWNLWLTLSSPLILLCLALGYCEHARRTYLPIATTATDNFHFRLTTGQDDLIYLDADRRWRTAIDIASHRNFLARIRRKMGVCSFRGPLGWKVDTASNGTFVTLSYQAQCMNGPMQEVFTWRIGSSQTAALVGYSASSNILLTD